jgi:carotenoid cleavage dioxygenase
VIHFDGARSDDPMEMVKGFARLMRGETHAPNRTRHHRYRLDLRDGTAHEAPMLDPHIDSEFPAIDPRLSTTRNRRLVLLTRSAERPPDHPLLDTVSVYDDARERLTSFRYPAGVLPEEHLFVPAPGSAPETAGWVIGTALDTNAVCTTLNVFDVQAVDAGPVATARLPYALPLGLHGKFVAA